MATPVYFMHDSAVDELICIISAIHVHSKPDWNMDKAFGLPGDTDASGFCGQLLNFTGNSACGVITAKAAMTPVPVDLPPLCAYGEPVASFKPSGSYKIPAARR